MTVFIPASCCIICNEHPIARPRLRDGYFKIRKSTGMLAEKENVQTRYAL